MSDTVKIGPWTWRVWPTQYLPTEEDLTRLLRATGGADEIERWCRDREHVIALEESDPLHHGWEPPPVRVARALMAGTYAPGSVGVATLPPGAFALTEPADDVLILGGNRSGKTRFGARYVNELLCTRPNARARCWSQNEKSSLIELEPMLHLFLPPHLRAIKRDGQYTKISYSQATGFSEDTYVLPNRSQNFLLTYHAWQQDKKVAEGGEADIIWCDEEVPGELLETLRFRTGQRRMKLLTTFTPVEGYTEAVAQYIEGAEVVEAIPARRVVWDWRKQTWAWGDWLLPEDAKMVDGCPAGHVPLVLRSVVPGRFVVALPSAFNPYIHLDDVLKKAEGRPLEFKLTRWFGWPTKRAAKAFPKFGRHHIVKPERVPSTADMTVSLFVDPHGDRNWFMVWLGVDRDGRVWALDEWPDSTVGEWALPGQRPDGKIGPAQRDGAGKSFGDYKRLIYEKEGWRDGANGVWERSLHAITVFDRRMDPRPAATSVPSDEDARTYVEFMADPILSGDGTVLADGLAFAPAPACGVEEGTGLINDWLTRGWDPDEPVTPLNCPTFYVSEKCQNLIYALRTWTGMDKDKGATKDPIDCLRGAAKLGLMHYQDGDLGSSPSGGY